MPTARSGDPSTRRLSEVARHVVVPAGIVDTLWFKVETQCAEWGDEFDHWQDGLGQLILGLREDGTFAATIGGITISIPRQVVKTFLVSRIVFALCILFPNLTVLWTAHRTRTATQTFNKLKGLAQKPGIKPYMAAGGGIRSVNGEQEFEFANGSKIMFGAREQGFGRGFDEVDIEVFDEAQILTEKALEDMVAATNQTRFPFGALLFFMGTPPRPSDPGEEFTNRRAEALALKPAEVVVGVGEDSLYVECSADPQVGRPGGPDLDDPEQVKIANPSVPRRTPWISIKRLRKQLTSDGSWRREGLGVWDEITRQLAVVPASIWDERTAKQPPAEDEPPVALAVDRWHDGTTAVAGAWQQGEAIHVELLALDVSPETTRAVEWVAERAGRKIPVLIAADSPAASMAADLIARKVKVTLLSGPELARACQGFANDAIEGGLTHSDQEQLTSALAGATKFAFGKAGGWVWDRRSPDTDISSLVAATLARYGVQASAKKPSAAYAF